MTKRRRFTSAFKKKVVLAVLRGDRTIQDLAACYEVHPNQISGWKKQAIAGLEDILTARAQAVSVILRWSRKIGQGVKVYSDL